MPDRPSVQTESQQHAGALRHDQTSMTKWLCCPTLKFYVHYSLAAMVRAPAGKVMLVKSTVGNSEESNGSSGSLRLPTARGRKEQQRLDQKYQ